MPDPDASRDADAPDRSEQNSAPEASSPEENPSGENSSSSDANGVVTIRLQTIANILTVVLALSAIGLSIWEGYQNREFFRLSVLPHLESLETTTASSTPVESELFPMLGNRDSLYAVSYSLENSGLGPAVLKNILMYEGEKKVFDAAQSDSAYYYLGPVSEDMEQLPFPAGFLRAPYSAGDMLEADEVHSFMTVFIPFAVVNEDSLDQWPPGVVQASVLEQRSFVFCYCSVYGTDCAQTHLGAEPPEADVCDF